MTIDELRTLAREWLQSHYSKAELEQLVDDRHKWREIIERFVADVGFVGTGDYALDYAGLYAVVHRQALLLALE